MKVIAESRLQLSYVCVCVSVCVHVFRLGMVLVNHAYEFLVSTRQNLSYSTATVKCV